MRKIKIFVTLFLLCSFLIQAQQSQIEEKSISKNYKSDNLESNLVLSRAEQWFNSEENAEQKQIVKKLHKQSS